MADVMHNASDSVVRIIINLQHPNMYLSDLKQVLIRRDNKTSSNDIFRV